MGGQISLSQEFTDQLNEDIKENIDLERIKEQMDMKNSLTEKVSDLHNDIDNKRREDVQQVADMQNIYQSSSNTVEQIRQHREDRAKYTRALADKVPFWMNPIAIMSASALGIIILMKK